jgi:hypothetical protein
MELHTVATAPAAVARFGHLTAAAPYGVANGTHISSSEERRGEPARRIRTEPAVLRITDRLLMDCRERSLLAAWHATVCASYTERKTQSHLEHSAPSGRRQKRPTIHVTYEILLLLLIVLLIVVIILLLLLILILREFDRPP